MNENEKYSAEEIWDMDAGTWTLGNDDLRGLIAVALSQIPSDVVDDVYKQCIFHSLSEEAKGEILSPKIIYNSYFINIHSKVLYGNQEKAIEVLLHEVAHYHLGHRHFLEEFSSNPEEYDIQEKEADELVKRWLSQRSD